MSSLVRRIQKNIAKSQGYYRRNNDNLIYNSSNEVVGKHWPQVAAPTSTQELERLANRAIHKLDREKR